ncbi:JAB domain-containing protein [uncultured Duncaniella sp.]|uniref:JAB domain-containing protein n=1 Tax=uncultured Duncaniella sp. TaxID=2768039 RepID=UPI000A59F1C3|nr:JAB domain-containing protein [uncultured Duncaniella sp.]
MKLYNIPIVRMVYVSDNFNKPQLRNSGDASVAFRDSFEIGELGMQEFFKVAYLNRANKLIGIHTVSMGGSHSTIVDLKILFAGALTAKATSIMLCHNHPSGNRQPSPLDDNLTKKIAKAAELFDIKVLDHIILTPDPDVYYSYADLGRI